jgi:hypothetical protein
MPLYTYYSAVEDAKKGSFRGPDIDKPVKAIKESCLDVGGGLELGVGGSICGNVGASQAGDGRCMRLHEHC